MDVRYICIRLHLWKFSAEVTEFLSMAVRLKLIFWVLLMLRDLFVPTKCPSYWPWDKLSGLVSVPAQFEPIVKCNHFQFCFVSISFHCHVMKSHENLMGAVWSPIFIPDFRFSLLFFISLLGAYLNWLFCSFAAFFQTGLVVIITVVEPPHPADTARLARYPRLAVLLLTPLCVNRWMLWLLTPLLLLSLFILYS